MWPKIFSVSNVLQSRVLSSEAMSSASAVIGDCDGVPGQQSRYTLCKQPLRHPGQWKSELEQFLLKYSEIPGSSCKACDLRIRQGLHGKYKGKFGLEHQERKSCCCVPGCGETTNVHVVVCFLVLIQYVRQQMLIIYIVSEEEVSSPLYLWPPTHTADVLVSVHCAVVKVNSAGNDKRVPLRHLP